MTDIEFNRQMDRLNSQWKSTYGTERRALLWAAFRNVLAEDFQSAVDMCLASHRGAPLLDELNKEVDAARVRRNQEGARGGGSFYGVVQQAADANTTANPEFVQLCLKHIRDGLTGKVTREQYFEGCDALDRMRQQIAPRKGSAVTAPPSGTRSNWKHSPVGESED